jgi:protein-disulfide isomerase
VEFSDFQCPYCSKAANTVEQLYKKYPNDIKIVFKHNPLPMHRNAPAAHKAAMAAGEQGKFWEMHDLLFENQRQMRGADMTELSVNLAKKLGLDTQKFKKDLENPAYQAQIKKDMALGRSIGVRGTPHFFVNGKRLGGAQPLQEFEKVYKEQIGAARQALKSGTERKNLYRKMVAKNFDGKGQKQDKRKARKPSPKPTKVSFVPVRDNDPIKGAKEDYLVTMVEFSDFHCPYCSKVNPTIDQILEKYGDKVRVVFKQSPLPMHSKAPMAHKAALAAHMQGKFWEMHDMLFENARAARSGNMEQLAIQYAKQLGLNVEKFKQDLKSDKVAQWLREDKQLAGKVGARGTPNFFVNGVQVTGARPFSSFKSVIEKQIDRAQKLKKQRGLQGDALYKAVVQLNEKEAPKAEAKPKRKRPQQKVDPGKLKVGNSYIKGSKDAPVKVYEFSDFHCPYCKRGHVQSMKKIEEAYDGDKVAIVFKNFPLPMHRNARAAHKAALAAGEQGKFWEMTDLLFQNQKEHRRSGDVEGYVKYAQKIGLNVDKFKKDFNDPKLDKQITSEMNQGRQVGVRGTPHFFVNGNRVSGAQPFSAFKPIIDKELQKAK